MRDNVTLVFVVLCSVAIGMGLMTQDWLMVGINVAAVALNVSNLEAK